MTSDCEQWYAQLEQWEATNIISNRFVGKEYDGFAYRYGEYVPVDQRYSAMLEHRQAARRWELLCQQHAQRKSN